MEDMTLAPPFIVRTILLYGRSQVVPKFENEQVSGHCAFPMKNSRDSKAARLKSGGSSDGMCNDADKTSFDGRGVCLQ